ncbi:hypothetical protein BDZ89DRAFT_1049782 [Hymenopellis radicata]|nr:hypothetical protein BDZ89DRAFT_1049782 [Hymenopellis radicata]
MTNTNNSPPHGYVVHPAPPQRDLNSAEMWYHLQTLGPAGEGLRESFLVTKHLSGAYQLTSARSVAVELNDASDRPQRDDHGPADQEDRNIQAENQDHDENPSSRTNPLLKAGSQQSHQTTTTHARTGRTTEPTTPTYRLLTRVVWHRSEILRYSEGTDSKSWPYLVDKCADLWAQERAAGNLVVNDAPGLCTRCDPNVVVVLKVKGKKPGPRTKPDIPKDSAHCWLKPGMTNGACFRCRLINRPCSLKSGWKRGNYHVRPFVHGEQPNTMEVDGEEEEGMELENDEYLDNDEGHGAKNFGDKDLDFL